MSVGFQGGSVGTFDQRGGAVVVTKAGTDDNSGHLNVGIDTGSGTYTQSAGTNQSHWGFVGRGGGTGTYNQSGGTYSTRGWIRVGEGAGSTGTYNLTGSAVLNVGGGDADLGDDDLVLGVDTGNGQMTVADNAQLNAARDIRLGLNSGSFGNLSQTGGLVTVQGNLILGSGGFMTGSSSGLYHISGGTLDMTGGTISMDGGTSVFGMSGGRVEDVGSINLRLDQTGGVFAPGAGIGTTTWTGTVPFATEAYELGAAATLEIELASASSYDKLVMNVGSAELLGSLDLIASPGLGLGDVFTIIDLVDPAMLVAGNFLGKPDDSIFNEDGYQFRINYNDGPDSNNVTLTVVPEPATVGTVGIALIGLAARRRRRRS